VTSKTKSTYKKISGIEIRLTFDIFINIDPNQFQRNGWNHGSLYKYNFGDDIDLRKSPLVQKLWSAFGYPELESALDYQDILISLTLPR
jgi:hypothetical protein